MIDLKLEYQRFNKLIFNNKLPKDMPVKWTKSKRALGRAHLYYSLKSKKLVKCTITISNYLICTDHEYRETLIHEMIHVFLGKKSKFKKGDNHHGPSFIKEMGRINRNFPEYQISPRDTKIRNIEDSNIPVMHGFLVHTLQGKVYFNLYKKAIDRLLFSHILAHISETPAMKGATVYTFSGRYIELALGKVRKKAITLKQNLQSFRDEQLSLSILNNVKENCILSCDIYQTEQCDFVSISRMNNGVCIFPELYYFQQEYEIVT